MGAGSSTAGSGIYDKKILDGFINHQNPWAIREIARDIYDFDPICGMYTDIVSEMPFSDFELSGLPDKEITNKYADALQSMNIKGMFPEITRDYLIDGVFIGNVYDNPANNDYSMMTIDINACDIKQLPFTGVDPLINVRIPQSYTNMLRDPDPRMQMQLDMQGDKFKGLLAEKILPLDPMNTIYYSRRTRSSVVEGTSLFKRIIPYWLIEKALLRGTIDLAHRRQKSILQLIIGDDEYVADAGTMAQYIDVFRNADADPLGAIVATPPFVSTNEIRNGSEFWSINDYADFLNNQKMRGIGASESILGGDLTVDTTQASLTVFLDQLRNYRDMAARRILYNKVFLLIAIENDFKRKQSSEIITGSTFPNGRFQFKLNNRHNGTRVISDGTSVTMNGEVYKISDYIMPKLQWHKALRPEGNETVLQALGTLEEKGLPIPLRIYAAAAGVSITEIMRSLDDDVRLRKQIIKYRKNLPQDPSQPPPGMEDEEMEASFRKGRDFSRYKEEIRDADTKKLLSRKGRNTYNNRMNRIAAEAIVRLNENENRKIKSMRPINKRYPTLDHPVSMTPMRASSSLTFGQLS